MGQKIRFSIWFSIILVAAFVVGYLAWAKATFNWPYDYEVVSGPIVDSPSTSLGASGDIAGWKIYRNEEYGFEFKYPSSWIEPEMLQAENFGKSKIIVFQDPNREGLDPGSELDSIVGVKVYNNSSEIPQIKDYLQAEETEIESTHKKVLVDGKELVEDVYKSFVAEGANQITHHVKIAKSKNIFLLELNYILAGCFNEATPFQNSCNTGNEKLAEKADKVWSEFLSNFKFIDQQNEVLARVTNIGGLCVDGPCRSEYTIEKDGTYQSPGGNSQLTEDELKRLQIALEQANYQTLTQYKFQGVCPAAYDGPKYLFQFYTSEGVQRIDSCKTDINQTAELFDVLIGIISKYSKFQFRVYP